MPAVAHIDTETFPVSPESQAPPVVCLQACLAPLEGGWQGDGSYGDLGLSSFDMLGPVPDDEATEHDPVEDARTPREWPLDLHPVLFDADDALDFFRWLVEETDLLLCGVNIPFDLLVMLEHATRRGLNLWASVFEMLAAGRLRDTEIRQKLLNIARGAEWYKTGMEELARRWLGLDLGDDKHGPGAWRTRYKELALWTGEDAEAWRERRNRGQLGLWDARSTGAGRSALEDVRVFRTRPVGTYPYHARRYALDDVIHDREIYRRQTEDALRLFNKPSIPDEVARPVARFCLHLQSARGILPDYQRALDARASLNESSDVLMAVLVEAGLVKRKTVWAGVEPDDLVAFKEDGKTYRYNARTTVRGVPNPKGKSAVIVEVDENDDEIGPETIVPLAELKPIDSKKGVKLSKNMAEIRRRVEATLRDLGYDDASLDAERRTATGFVKTDRETMEIVASASNDPGLQCLGAHSRCTKLLKTYVEPLCVPRPVHWRYDCLKDTGRTSAGAQRLLAPSDEGVLIQVKEGTNVQNFSGQKALKRAAFEILKFSREEYLPTNALDLWVEKHDPRALVVARPGYLFSIHDFKAIELGCMARVLNVLFKKPSTLAEVINAKKDPHLFTGVRVHPTLWKEEFSYEELDAMRKEASKIEKLNKLEIRQAKAEGRTPRLKPLLAELERVLRTREMCKVVNFGFLGAMGAAKFVLYALLSYGVEVDLPLARKLRRNFLHTYPEIGGEYGRGGGYFDWIAERLRQDLPVIQIGTKRVRRGCTYAAACNSYFQGLAADGAMQALWRLTWASYVDEESPLFGARPLIFEHDAFVVEVPEARAQEAHEEVGRLMIEGMEVYLRDEKNPELSVLVQTEGELSDRWTK